MLAIHRYYWPDSPPYASMLRAIAARWAAGDATVSVLGTQPTYKPEARIPWRPWKERLDGVMVERVRLLPERGSRLRKHLNIPLFVAAATRRVLRLRRGDVAMCSTSPPIVLASVVSAAARLRGARFIYHCMDLHPEIGALSGEFRNPVLFRLLRLLDRSTCRRSEAIVVLSSDMRTALLERDQSLADKVVVLNNFDLPQFAEASLPEPVEVPSKRAPVRIAFTGNVGRFQGLDDVVMAVLESVADVELLVMGEGRAKAGLQEITEGYPPEVRSRVTFLPHGSSEQARAVMRSADLGLVSLAPKIVRYAYPSKTMTYLSEGLPLLILAETDSELSRSVATEQLGFTVEPGNRSTLDSILLELATNQDGLLQMGRRARTYAEQNFDDQRVLDRWSQLLHRVRDGSAVQV